jgi:hypothetical protein
MLEADTIEALRTAHCSGASADPAGGQQLVR